MSSRATLMLALLLGSLAGCALEDLERNADKTVQMVRESIDVVVAVLPGSTTSECSHEFGSCLEKNGQIYHEYIPSKTSLGSGEFGVRKRAVSAGQQNLSSKDRLSQRPKFHCTIGSCGNETYQGLGIGGEVRRPVPKRSRHNARGHRPGVAL